MELNVVEIVQEIKSKCPNEMTEKNISKYLSNFFQKIESYDNIIIVGTGKNGMELFESMPPAIKKKVTGFADNYPKSEKIINLKEISSKDNNVLFIITPINFVIELTSQLISQGINSKNIVFYNSARK